MTKRDQQSSLSLVFTGSLSSSLLGIGTLCSLLFVAQFRNREGMSIFLTVSGFIIVREIIVLLVLLRSILQVNGIIDELIETFSKQSMIHKLKNAHPNMEDVNDDVESESLKINDEMRFRRLELYLFMKEQRIGTTIWSFRPSKIQLLLQITSIITIVITTLFKIIAVNVAS